MKAKKIASTKTMTREQWLEIRKTGITGSRIAGVLNISPWETPRSIYLDLIGEAPERTQTEAMYWGIELEDRIAKEYAIRTGAKVRKVNYILQHRAFEFLLGNIDREIRDGSDRGILEVKNIGAYSADDWKDQPPAHYIAQLQFYLALTGYRFGVLAALIGGQRFVFHRIERDEEQIATMIEAATEFWYNHVEPRQEPPVTERDGEILNAIYSKVDPDKIANITDETFDDFVETTARIKSELNIKEAEYDLRINQIKDMMRDAEMITINGERLATWKENKNGKRTFRLTV